MRVHEDSTGNVETRIKTLVFNKDVKPLLHNIWDAQSFAMYGLHNDLPCISNADGIATVWK